MRRQPDVGTRLLGSAGPEPLKSSPARRLTRPSVPAEHHTLRRGPRLRGPDAITHSPLCMRPMQSPSGGPEGCLSPCSYHPRPTVIGTPDWPIRAEKETEVGPPPPNPTPSPNTTPNPTPNPSPNTTHNPSPNTTPTAASTTDFISHAQDFFVVLFS
ncbi:unnamed protein product [Arctogadus glacialis]